jgi:hypothetical protein
MKGVVMGGRITKAETEERFQQLVKGWVDMERGIYVWPEGAQQRRNANGEPVPSKRVLLESVGYSLLTPRANQRIWNNPKFLRALEIERQTRDRSMLTIVERAHAEGRPGPMEISNLMLDILYRRLTEDNSRVKTSELLRYAPAWQRLSLELEGKLAHARNESTTNVLAILDSSLSHPQLKANTLKILNQFRSQREQDMKTYATIIEGETEDALPELSTTDLDTPEHPE